MPISIYHFRPSLQTTPFSAPPPRGRGEFRRLSTAVPARGWGGGEERGGKCARGPAGGRMQRPRGVVRVEQRGRGWCEFIGVRQCLNTTGGRGGLGDKQDFLDRALNEWPDARAHRAGELRIEGSRWSRDWPASRAGETAGIVIGITAGVGRAHLVPLSHRIPCHAKMLRRAEGGRRPRVWRAGKCGDGRWKRSSGAIPGGEWPNSASSAPNPL